MRRTIHAVVLVMIAAVLTALIGAPSAATPPGSTTVNGSLSIEPSTVVVGQTVKVGANFSSGAFTITLYKQESGSSEWIAVGSKPSNESGNAYFTGYQVDVKQKLYARATNGKTGITNTKTITPLPKPEPSANPTGNLYAEPSFFTDGQKVRIVADFPKGEFGVTLFRKSGDTWAALGKVTSKSSGDAYFNDYVVQGGEQLFAQKTNGDTTDVETLTPTTIDPANFTQGGTLNTSGIVQDGRTGTIVANFANGTHNVTLFAKDGTEWKGVGSATSNSSGDATIKGVPFDGPQELFAVTSKGIRTEVKIITPSAPNDNISGGPSTLGKRVIYVTTNNGGTPTTKGVDYEAKTVLVENGVETETLDLETIAVRGNSTADKPKKPYKFKFDDKQSPFGMPEDKTWVLLANYLDWTLVRSMVGWDLGDVFDAEPKGMGWYPRSQFAELFLNGKYMGSYQLVESIKIQDERVNIKPKWGQIIELDPHWASDGVPGFQSALTGMHYAWKDPDEFKFFDPDECIEEEAEPECVDPEGLTDQKITLMKDKIKAFENVLYGPNMTRDWSTYQPPTPADDWATYLDINSAVDYYLTKEFTKDNDADFNRSNFFYANDVRVEAASKLVMGPIWDFDRSAGSNTKSGTSNPLPTGWWMRGDGSPTHTNNKIHWYTRLVKDPRFLHALHDRWAAVRGEMEAAFVGGPAVSNAVTKLGGADTTTLGLQVAANDRARWPDHTSRFDQRASSYSGELTWLRKWYKDRFTWMDNELQKTPPPLP